MKVEKRIEELGFKIPTPPTPKGEYIPCNKVGNLIFTSGTTTDVNGKKTFVGKVGGDFSIEQGQEAARIAVLNNLANVKQMVGDLDKIRIVKLNGYVNSAPGFVQQPKVINGASEFLVKVMGERGKHARAAIGAGELPSGVAIEIEMVVEIIEED